MYVRKTFDEYHLFVDYGYGWEHEHTEDSRKAILDSIKDYQANCQYAVKWKKVRIKKS